MAATSKIETIYVDSFRSWAPPPKLTVSEWAGRERHLSSEASAEPGLWRNSRAPHLVAPMDALSPYDDATSVVCKFSSQTGKTEIGLNWIGYIVNVLPAPMIAVQPNQTPMAEAFSKDRVAPMFRDSPALAGIFANRKRGMTSENTILHKSFPGGHVTMIGANSVSGLASRPIRFLLGDEVDRWQVTKEGDPLSLARKRQQTYIKHRAAKELLVSSPTYDDIGISAEYDDADQQYEWHLSCLECGASQFPEHKDFRTWNNDASTVRYVCRACGHEHGLDDEDRVKATGEWVQVKDGPRRKIGFWMNQFSSPFARWDDTEDEWIKAGDDPAKRQAVVNTVWARGWDGDGKRTDPSSLSARAEDWGDDIPARAAVLTVGADVQGDRIEAELIAWGEEYESWSIAYEVFAGDPTQGDVFDDLHEWLSLGWQHAEGAIIQPIMMCIDSGAYTKHVYDYVRRAADRRVVPIKGVSGMQRDMIEHDRAKRRRNEAKRRRKGAPPELLGVDPLKLTVYHMLQAKPGTPGYSHFPTGRNEEYFAQLTGERLITVNDRGRRPQRQWVQVHHSVEALDCRAYGYAALLLAEPDLSMIPSAKVSGGRRTRGAADFKVI